MSYYYGDHEYVRRRIGLGRCQPWRHIRQVGGFRNEVAAASQTALEPRPALYRLLPRSCARMLRSEMGRQEPAKHREGEVHVGMV